VPEGDVQFMADTGENRQIIGRTNAKEAEAIRASKKMVSVERSAAKASNIAFGEKGSRRSAKKIKEPGPAPEAPKP
jgi:hypothetical protein